MSEYSLHTEQNLSQNKLCNSINQNMVLVPLLNIPSVILLPNFPLSLCQILWVLSTSYKPGRCLTNIYIYQLMLIQYF